MALDRATTPEATTGRPVLGPNHGNHSNDGIGPPLRKVLSITLARTANCTAWLQVGSFGSSAEAYERSAERTTYRNGFRDRRWDTRLSTLALKVPKLREPAAGLNSSRPMSHSSTLAALTSCAPSPEALYLMLRQIRVPKTTKTRLPVDGARKACCGLRKGCMFRTPLAVPVVGEFSNTWPAAGSLPDGYNRAPEWRSSSVGESPTPGGIGMTG